MHQFNPHQHNPPGFNRPHAPPNPRFTSPQTPNFNNNNNNSFHSTNPVAAPPRPAGFPQAAHTGFPPQQHTQFPPHQPVQDTNQALAAAALQLLLQQNMQFPGQQNQVGQMQNNPTGPLLQSGILGPHNAAPQNNLAAALMQTAAGVLVPHNGSSNINPNAAAMQTNLAAALLQSVGLLGAHSAAGSFSRSTGLQMGQLGPQNMMMNENHAMPFQGLQQQQQQQQHSQNQMMTANLASSLQYRPAQLQQHPTGSAHQQGGLHNPTTNGSQVLPFQGSQQQQQHSASSIHSQNQMMNANLASPFQCRPPHTTSSAHPQLRPQNPMMNGNQVSLGQCTEQKQQPQQQPTGTMHSQLCLPNPMMNGNQAPPFQRPQLQQNLTSSTSSFNVPPYAQPGSASNTQMIPANSNLVFGNGMVPNGGMQWNNQDLSQLAAFANNGQSAKQENSTAAQPLTPHFPVNDHQAGMDMQLNGLLPPQVNQIANRGNFVSNVIPGKQTRQNFTGNPHRYGKTPNLRVQNPTRNGKYAKTNAGPTKNNGNGQQKPKEGNLLKDSIQKPRLVPKYTEKEIKQWREARQRSWPTKAIVMKKLARMRNVAGQGGKGKFAGKGRILEDEDAKLRRQQLKEVLAQQAELGVEVAEIPKWYLDETNRIKHPKKSKTRNGASASQVIDAKRSPTLLHKLLSSEITRDKSRLLQVFRFMVLNSFFEQWPDKLLEFPVVTVEDANEETAEVDIHNDANVSNGDVPLDGKDDEKPEEGEITD